MSKTKTKRARRELKREGEKKIFAFHKKNAKAAADSKPTAKTPANKKQKMSAPNAAAASTPATTPAHAQPPKKKHKIPFGEYDHILLVGEGDFSFTRSLAIEHGCANVTATSYDDGQDVHSKYPSFREIETELSSLTPPVPLHHDIDATKLSSYKHLRCNRDDDDDDNDEEGWDTIAFMFPHTGGLSTDVNRQVRANQALLVSFFKSCLDTSNPKRRLQILRNQDDNKKGSPPQQPIRPFLRMGGRIIVTLFEGEPYTLWNIRDLARHAGLKVVESWQFDWSQYPGYHHVRTLGAMETGWKGEDRAARMFVFEKIPLVADSDEEKEMARQAKVGRGGRLPSQKEAMKRALDDNEEDDEDDE
ncbi:hypothetical protein J4E93_007417 [Alternaria ventricosa]|uniref:uncharacterized protein n=1 Tax=Alternaria ventricosa TaxID=1187951 RepID=UPI0020C2C71F|nr:uncharacterized protein J4E93_007417 [Alternaria ventricosa]KAI4642271.1 hypothetical protein J4E93_007417 [Alternaria ventricosa]